MTDGDVEILVVPEFDDFDRDLKRGLDKSEKRAPKVEVPVGIAPRSLRSFQAEIGQIARSASAGGRATVQFVASATGMRAKLFSRVQEAASRARQAATIPFRALTQTIAPAVVGAAKAAVRSATGAAKIVFTAITSGIVPAVAAATQKAVATAQAQLAALQSSAAVTGTALTARLTLPIIAIGGLATKMGVDFESAMLKVQGLTGATGKQFDALNDIAKELGRTTQFSASEAAGAMGFLAQAGFDTEKILATLPDTLNLAAAAELDMASAADIVTNVLSGYQLEVAELEAATDVLTNAFTSTNTDLRQLGEAFKFVGPVASAAGVDFADSAAALGILSDAGIQGGSAGTGLRRVLSSLLNATGPAADALERLGISGVDSSGNLRPLEDILLELSDAGLTAGDALTIAGDRGGPALLALTARADELGGLSESLRETGAAAEQAEVRMSGTRGALLRMKSAIEGVVIAIGESGLLDMVAMLAERVAGFASRLAEANPRVLRIATAITLAVAAAGPMLKLFSLLVAPLRLVLGVVAALASPMALLATAIGVVAGAIAISFIPGANTLEGKLEGLRQIIAQVVPTIQSMVPTLQSWARTAAGVLGPALQATGEFMVRLAGVVRDDVWPAMKLVGDYIKTNLWPTIRELGVVVGGLLADAWAALPGLLAKARDLFQDMRPTIEKVVKSLTSMVKSGLNVMIKVIPKVIAVIKKLLKFVDALVDFRKVFSGIGTAISGVSTVVQGLFDAFVGLLDLDMAAVVDGIGLAFSGLGDLLAGVFEVLVGMWGELATRILGAIGDIGGTIWNGISTGFTSLVSNIGRVVGDIVGWFTSLPGQIVGAVSSIGSSIWNGMAAGFDAVLSNIGTWTTDVVAFFVTLPIQIGAAMTQLTGVLLSKFVAAHTLVLTNVAKFIVDIVGFFTGLPGQIIAGIGNVGAAIWGALSAGFGAVLSNIGTWTTDVIAFFVNLPGQIIAAIGNIGTAIWDGISGSFATLVTNIGNVVVDIAAAFTGFITGTIPGLAADFAAAASSLGEAFLQGLVDGISGAVGFVVDIGQAVGNAVINVINGIITQVNDALEFTIPTGPLFPDININPPDIPTIPNLFHGGVFGRADGPQFGVFGGKVHGYNEPGNPEAVVPYTRPSDYLRILTDPRVAPATLHAAEQLRSAADRIASTPAALSGGGQVVNVHIEGGNVPTHPANLGLVIGNRVERGLEDLLR